MSLQVRQLAPDEQARLFPTRPRPTSAQLVEWCAALQGVRPAPGVAVEVCYPPATLSVPLAQHRLRSAVRELGHTDVWLRWAAVEPGRLVAQLVGRRRPAPPRFQPAGGAG